MREDDPHFPITTLVAIENTHNKCGGRTLPMSWLKELGTLCKKLGNFVFLISVVLWDKPFITEVKHNPKFVSHTRCEFMDFFFLVKNYPCNFFLMKSFI